MSRPQGHGRRSGLKTPGDAGSVGAGGEKKEKKESNFRSLVRLFFSFFRIGLFTIGGGMAMLPVIQREVVENKKWLDEEEMLECIALSQALPGVIGVSCGTYIGQKLYGFKGAVAATLGVVVPSILCIIAVVYILDAVEGNVYVDGALTGVKAAVTGSILVTVWKMGRQAIKDVFGWCVAIAAFVMIAVFKWNAVWAVVFAVAAGLIATFAGKTFGRQEAGEIQHKEKDDNGKGGDSA